MDPGKDEDEEKKQLFSTGNPTMSELEGQERSAWYGTVTYTGLATFGCMIMIVITALPRIRRLHYNTFYNAHIVCSVATFIGASIHASSDFYLLLPGLSLWVADWAWRLFRGDGGALRKQVAVLENAGSGWYRVSLGATAKFEADSASEAEYSAPAGYPLSLYYLSLPSVSRLQSHAFTAAVSSTAQSGPVFLFRRSQGKSQKALEKEWTWAVGSLVGSPGLQRQLDVRVEGPYRPTDTGFESASHVVCIVGGTGITGAYSLALWWLKMRSIAGNTKFTLVWTVRERESINVQEWFDLVKSAESQANMMVSAHVSAEMGRLDPQAYIRQSLGLDLGMATERREKGAVSTGTAWVYSSGPEGLLQATQKACQVTDRDIRKLVRDQAPVAVKDMSWYIAKWEV